LIDSDAYRANLEDNIWDGTWEKESNMFKEFSKDFHKFFLAAVCLLNVTGIRLKQQTVWILIILMNFVFGVPFAFGTGHDSRFGTDYAAYI
jgi:hypothetical protein